jgi:hypothetical protein
MTPRPRLEYFYNLKKRILEEIHENGANAPASSSDAWSEGWTRDVTLKDYLTAVEKMIEAMASLRDFEKEPLTPEEELALNDIWQLENTIAADVSLA